MRVDRLDNAGNRFRVISDGGKGFIVKVQPPEVRVVLVGRVTIIDHIKGLGKTVLAAAREHGNA